MGQTAQGAEDRATARSKAGRASRRSRLSPRRGPPACAPPRHGPPASRPTRTRPAPRRSPATRPACGEARPPDRRRLGCARRDGHSSDQRPPTSHRADATLVQLPAPPSRRATRAAHAGRADSDRRERIGEVTDYEILLLLDPDLDEDRQNEIVTRIREDVERGGGGWEQHDAWGRRKLAYEIGHKGEGFSHLRLFRSEPE